MHSVAEKLLWEFCHEVVESQESVDSAQPAWFVANLNQSYLFELCLLLKHLGYFCTQTVYHGPSGVIAKFENILMHHPRT